MVALFVVLTIIAFVTVDFFIQRKKKIGLAAQPQIGKMSLSKILNLLPSGVFLQPSFTWSKILDSGHLMLGIHPVLLGLIGEPDEVVLLKQGEEVKKGEPILSVRKGEKSLQVKAPVDGIITGLNNQVLEDSTWENISQSWLYSIKPVNVAAEVPSWFLAEQAQKWVNEKYQQIKSFFMKTLPETRMGLTMADGGDIPVGILSQFDEKVWTDFEREFIDQNSGNKLTAISD